MSSVTVDSAIRRGCICPLCGPCTSVTDGAFRGGCGGLASLFSLLQAMQIRLIYAGALIDDRKTPADYNCQKDTCIHLVRRSPSRQLLAPFALAPMSCQRKGG